MSEDKTKSKLKKLLKLWPIRIALMFLAFNIEFVLIPTMILLGMLETEVQLAAILLGSVEFGYWCWFSGWLPKALKKASVTSLYRESFKREGLKSKVETLAIEIWHWFDEEIIAKFEKAEDADEKLEVLRGLGELARFFYIGVLGFIPSLWIPGIIICRKVYKSGFLPLAIGNTLKLFCFSAIWYRFINGPWYIKLPVGLLLGGKVLLIVAKRIRSRKKVTRESTED